jgi:C4-dicarboxylate-binding protein DctP
MKPAPHRAASSFEINMHRLIATLLAATALVLTGSAVAQQAIVIKFSHVVAEDTPKGRAAAYFAKLVEQRTKGRVKIQVYPNSQLYKDSDEIVALQKGSVQMLAPSLAKFGQLGLPQFEVFDLPYIFDDYADAHRVTFGPIGKELLNKLQSKAIVGLAYWDNGFKQMSANKPLRKPDDMKGLKMRVQPSAVLQAQMRTLGAIPETMDFSAAYQALKSGAVDGTENPASNFYTQQMQDVQKHLSLTHHGYLGYAVIVNRKFWDGLPADIRTNLTGALRDATIFANDIALGANIDALEAIERSGKAQVLRLTAQERAEWKKALLPVHRQMESRVGRSLIQAIYKETGFDPDKL